MSITFFGYIGGKSHLKNKIINLLCYECKTYIEPFIGAGSIFFNKKPHEVEIINDINNNIINLYKVVQKYPNEFKEYLKEYCFSRYLYKSFQNKIKNNDYKNEIEKAAIYYYCLNACFSGDIKGGFGLSLQRNTAKSYFNKLNNLQYIIERLQNAQVTNYDFREILLSIKKKRNNKYIS